MVVTTLSQLESQIAKKCAEYQDNVHPQYHPHLPQMRRLSLLCLQHLANEDGLFKVVKKDVPPNKGIIKKLEGLLIFTAKDLEGNGQLTFYHYLGMLTSLSFHYAKMVKEKSYEGLNLADESQWDALTWEACVWSLFYIAGTLFDKPLKEHNEVLNNAKGGLDDISVFIKKKINNTSTRSSKFIYKC